MAEVAVRLSGAGGATVGSAYSCHTCLVLSARGAATTQLLGGLCLTEDTLEGLGDTQGHTGAHNYTASPQLVSSVTDPRYSTHPRL